MNSLFVPEESYGDDFARATYAYIVRRLKIDPIAEGVIAERKIYDTLNPDDLRPFLKKSERDKALEEANRLSTMYIRRSKKFWRVYQLYCFNRGQLRAMSSLSQWVTGASKETKRLKEEQGDIVDGKV